jgi:hypothetical protein
MDEANDEEEEGAGHPLDRDSIFHRLLHTDDYMVSRMKSIPYVVRVYVLNVRDVRDHYGGRPDPYMRLAIGNEPPQTTERGATVEENEVGFFATFEFPVALPGDSLLRIDVMNAKGLISDALIGSTTIDVEDRAFCKKWTREYKARPPVERRNLTLDGRSHEVGTVDLFLEILTVEEAATQEVVDITPPQKQEWELRLIVWNAKDTPTDLDYTGLSDLYIQVAPARDPNHQPSVCLPCWRAAHHCKAVMRCSPRRRNTRRPGRRGGGRRTTSRCSRRTCTFARATARRAGTIG